MSSTLVGPFEVLPGSAVTLKESWKICKIYPIDPSVSGKINIVLKFRDSSLVSYKFDLYSENWKYLDASVVLSVSVLSDSAQGAYLTAGIYKQSYDSVLGYSNTASLDQPVTSFTPWRLLELIAKARGSANSLVVDESVASGGSGTGTFTPNEGVDEALFTGGISQDSLGTSPHDSYISVTDGNGNLVFKIRGALNSPFAVKVHGLWGKCNIAWSNGDSVAHWFQLNIYEVIA